MAGVVDTLIAGVSQLTAERRETVTTGRAVQIVDFKSNKRAVLNEREIQHIIKQEDLPTVVVSIGGVARSGKSFLFNLLVNYLTYLEKRDSASGWETSDHPVQGVNWAQGRKAVTLGIWMWSKPFVIKRLDGTKVAVLLMDSQGTGDNSMSDASLDTLIMYISLQLSSFQLINIVNYLNANELTSLQLCTDYADMDEASPTRGQSTCCHLFDNLIFVVRNCPYTQVFGEELEHFQRIKEECINAELRRAVEGIEKAFKHITTFLFPYPGNEIAGASADQKIWTLQDIPKRFLDPVKELATVIFTSNRMATEELLTGSQILEKFMMLKMRLESTDLPEIGNPADALQETILYRAFSKASTLYAETIGEVQRNLLSHKSEADLKTTLASAKDLALEVFCSEGRQHKYGNSKIWSKYEGMFKGSCDKHQSVLIVQYNYDKKIAALEQHSQEISRQLEEKTRETAERIDKLESQSKAAEEELEKPIQESKERERSLETHLSTVTARMKAADENYKKSMLEAKERERSHEALLSTVTETMKAAREDYEKAMQESKERERFHETHLSTVIETMKAAREDYEKAMQESK